jgi:omega-amidase
MSTLTITSIQSHLHWEDKEANLEMFDKKIASVKEKTELIILPEMFSTGFSMQPEKFAEKMDGPTVTWMKKTAAQKKIILTGSIIIEEDGHYFNRLIWMLPNGQYGFYDKRHRFAYAGEDEKYSAGNKRLIASVKGWKINLQICYDLRFPVWSRQQLGEIETGDKQNFEYDLLIYVANWPERRNQAWKTLLPARAIENQCYVIGVNRTGADGHGIHHSGDSMIIGPLGEIEYHKTEEEDIFTYTFQKEKLEEIRTKFPFWKDADHFFIEP